MREITIFREALFSKEGRKNWVGLPHTWNAKDGQDGGNDYYRGIGTYELMLPDPVREKRQFIQFDGANHVAKVFCNGTSVGEHRGGFSTFCFELTEYLKDQGNSLTVEVDNRAPDVYPQQADFTFFGGLYRNVSFVEVEKAHISLGIDGSTGIFVTPEVSGKTRVDLFVEDAKGCKAEVILTEKHTGKIVGTAQERIKDDGRQQIIFQMLVDHPHRWDGTKDSFLYEAQAVLKKDDAELDDVKTSYGYREFSVDSQTGFWLNQNAYPLHGVSRHQDRQGMGWALTDREHEEDMAIICKMGANAVRLAHYQHSQTFYDLCDERGMVVWAEIPFISSFIEGESAKENTLSQLRELIVQNYNHPSICFWGISNEITIGKESEALLENLRDLEKLAKKMDPSRLTTMAHISILNSKNPQSEITDVMGYNIYCGWYTGQKEENGEMLDALHTDMPHRPIALSEYGADALAHWHSADPKNHDYTEEYQAIYHEELLKTFETRPWLWGTFVWNMFDFAADARDEGGCKGRNNKGLVTYDRKTYKDAFYIYQAYWSGTSMVHLCGKRFVNRAPQERTIRVYTNDKQVVLYVNGKEAGSKTAEHHVCVFENPELLDGENEIRVCTETGAVDIMYLNAVLERDQSYILPEDEFVAGNWFDEETGETLTMEFPDGYFSIKDTYGEIMANPRAAAVFAGLQETFRAQREDAEEQEGPKQGGQSVGSGAGASPELMKSLSTIPLQQLIKMGGPLKDPVMLIRMNRELNRIKK